MEENCKIPKNIKHSEQLFKPAIYFSKFINTLFGFIICLIGIVTNFLIIYVTSHKKNQKELKENQYTFMRANALINLIILLIHMLLIISECQGPYGIFCSAIHKTMFTQYYKIIFGEYFSNFLKLLSNFTYVCFAISRLSLIGKDHTEFTNKVAKMSVKTLMKWIFVPCAGLSVVKGFQFHANKVQIEEDYPIPMAYYFNKIRKDLVIVHLSFNILIDLINYLIFLIVNLVIDINLIRNLRETIREREKKKSMIASMMKGQKNADTEDPVSKTAKMVILNTLSAILLKAPISFISIYDIFIFISFFSTHTIYFKNNPFFFTYLHICSYDLVCYFFYSFANTLFLLSISINYFFYFIFDKKFNASYKQLF